MGIQKKKMHEAHKYIVHLKRNYMANYYYVTNISLRKEMQGKVSEKPFLKWTKLF